MQREGASVNVDEFVLKEWKWCVGLYVADVEGISSWRGVTKLLLKNVLQKFQVGKLKERL